MDSQPASIYYVNSDVVKDLWNTISWILPSGDVVNYLFNILTLTYYISIYFESMTLQTLGVPSFMARLLVPPPGYDYAVQ